MIKLDETFDFVLSRWPAGRTEQPVFDLPGQICRLSTHGFGKSLCTFDKARVIEQHEWLQRGVGKAPLRIGQRLLRIEWERCDTDTGEIDLGKGKVTCTVVLLEIVPTVWYSSQFSRDWMASLASFLLLARKIRNGFHSSVLETEFHLNCQTLRVSSAISRVSFVIAA